MFWTTRSEPLVGGATSARMRLQREAAEADRARLTAERLTRPTLAEFYAGRHVFLTGGSGFLGRMVVELLLRCCPDVGTVYLVLRAKKGVAPQERLRALLDVPLFDKLRAERPDALAKIVVLPGDVTAVGLGLSKEHRDLLRKHVSVVFHLAASVRFDDSFQKAVFTNLRSTREVVELARGMLQLKVLVHVSTAYTNIDRTPVEERIYPPQHDWRDVIRWAEDLEAANPRAIDMLGEKIRGFQPNTYTFTKALAEKLIDDVADELPVIVTRPSIVVASIRDPIPGWIDNLMGAAGFWVGGFKGVMRVCYGKENIFFDSIPSDFATKSIVLASWSRGLGLTFRKKIVHSDHAATVLAPASGMASRPSSGPGEPERDQGVRGVQVVNVTIGLRAGISLDEMEWIVSEAGVGKIVPYPGAIRPPKFRRISNKWCYTVLELYHHILFGFIVDLLAKTVGVKPRVLGIYRRINVALEATQPFRTNRITFCNDNQMALQAALHPEDEADLSFLELTNKRDSIEEFRSLCIDTLRGILLYVLKEEDNPKKNWEATSRLKWVMVIYHSTMALLFFCIMYAVFRFKMSYSWAKS